MTSSLPYNSMTSHSSRVLTASYSCKKVMVLPTQQKIEKFYLIYQGLNDRFWKGYVRNDAYQDGTLRFDPTTDPISVANKYRPHIKSIEQAILPFRTQREVQEYYAKRETKSCLVFSDQEVECFRLIQKGKPMLLSHEARENHRNLLHRESAYQWMKQEELRKEERRVVTRSFIKTESDTFKFGENKQ